MATNGGLSRRRVANNVDEDIEPSTSASTPLQSPSIQSSNPMNSNGFAGSAFEGGEGKIAFDPRDLVNEEEEEQRGGKQPKLTLMEEVLLLGLKDKQGYLSFWNDNISYALRGCILIELALRRRIAIVKSPSRRMTALSERLIEVIDDKQTGETLLDETLRIMKGQQATERLGVNTWIDLLSGETWNVLKIGFQLKQVRERLAKGLVDKGVLRTEKRNFLLFDMATHPVADTRTKDLIILRLTTMLTASTSSVPDKAKGPEGTSCRVTRGVMLIGAAAAASVLDNAFGRLGYEDREAAFSRADDILAEFSVWPFGGSVSTPTRKRSDASRVGAGFRSDGDGGARQSILGLVAEVKSEMRGEEDLGFELIAGVMEVLAKLDSLL